MIKKRKTMVLLCVVCTFLLTGCAGKVDKGIGYLEKKEYKKAVENFNQAIQEGEQVADAYHGQGIAYWELKEYDKAKEAMLNCLKEKGKPTSTVYQILGDCEMKLENYEEAITYYLKGMSCDGLNEKQLQEMSYNEIIAYEKLHDWNSAKAKISVYIEKYPDDEKAKKEAEFLETR